MSLKRQCGCGRPHPVSDRVALESPFCTACLHERIARRSATHGPVLVEERARGPAQIVQRACVKAAPILAVYGAGVLAGLLLRASAAPHGSLAAIVVVLTTAAAIGYAFAASRRR